MHPNLLNSVEALQSSDSILHLLNCINYIVLYFILYIIVLMSHILVYSSEIKIHSFIHTKTPRCADTVPYISIHGDMMMLW